MCYIFIGILLYKINLKRKIPAQFSVNVCPGGITLEINSDLPEPIRLEKPARNQQQPNSPYRHICKCLLLKFSTKTTNLIYVILVNSINIKERFINNVFGSVLLNMIPHCFKFLFGLKIQRLVRSWELGILKQCPIFDALSL